MLEVHCADLGLQHAVHASERVDPSPREPLREQQEELGLSLFAPA